MQIFCSGAYIENRLQHSDPLSGGEPREKNSENQEVLSDQAATVMSEAVDEGQTATSFV